MPSADDLRRIAEVEFADIVRDTSIIDHKLRIFLTNDGFIDVNLSQRLPDKFGFHWEVMDAAGTIFRYDNFPDKNWSYVSTYPYHFHNGSQDDVVASPFPLSMIKDSTVLYPLSSRHSVIHIITSSTSQSPIISNYQSLTP